jgi:hypothetical protein
MSATGHEPPAPPLEAGPQPPKARRPDRSGAPTALGWGVALIAIGVVWILSLAGVTIRWDLVLPVALIGIGLIVLTVGYRGIGDGLIGLGILVAIIAILLPTSALPPPVSAGDRAYAPSGVEALEPEYTLGVGQLTLDLRELDTDAPVAVRVLVGMGEMRVRVPSDAQISGEARVGLGEVRVFGQSTGGVAPRRELSVEGEGTRVDLDLQVGMGRIEVTS